MVGVTPAAIARGTTDFLQFHVPFWLDFFDIIVPVSYTHLDVYKRQVVERLWIRHVIQAVNFRLQFEQQLGVAHVLSLIHI